MTTKRRTTIVSTTTGAALSLLLLASCGVADDGPQPSPPVSSKAVEPPSVPPSPPTPRATPSPSAAPVPALTPVDCPDVARDPTELEASLLVVPAPFSGDAFDAALVLEQVMGTNPADPTGWAAQIQARIQADYAETVCETMRFSAEIGAGQRPPEDAGAAPEEAPVGQNHFALVLDASGSMAAASGAGTRMTAAKEALGSFVGQLPAGSTVSVRVYGHEGSNSDADKPASCESSELLYQGPSETAALSASISEVEPVGWTPLARAITDSAADLPEGTTDAIVYVVTDGIETCGGDPVRAAEELAASGIAPVLSVIGFDTGDADQAALRAIAEAGGGEFTGVSSGAELESYWREENRRMAAAWREWRNQELARVRAEGIENGKHARRLESTLRENAVAQHEDAKELLELMRAEQTVPRHDLRTLGWRLEDQRKEVTNYAFDTGSANESAALAAWANSWNEAYDAGSRKWIEYYEASREG